MKQAGSKQSPLEGRTIVVTRQRDQAREMIELLDNLGARVICFPMIETVAPESWKALDSAMDRISEFDWVIFTSANAVKFFAQRLDERSLGLPDQLSAARVFAIGPATASALEAAGRRPNLVAGDSKAEGALRALAEAIGGERGFTGLRILIPRAAVAREFLPQELTRLGANVEVVETYRTIKPEVDTDAILRVFRRGKVDVIAFTSSSTVNNFAGLVGGSGLSELLKGVAVACIGPVTAATARDHGLEVAIQPESFSAPSLVKAIADYFASMKV